mgnify:CR=1 FL=1
MADITTITWVEIAKQVDRLVDRWANNDTITGVYGIPTGGAPVAVMVAERSPWALIDNADQLNDTTLVIDDLIDTGRTLSHFDRHAKASQTRHDASPKHSEK